MCEADNIIREGDTVVFDVNGERQTLIVCRPKSKVKLGRTFVPAEPLIGSPYGSLFTLSADGKSLERTQHVPSKEWDTPAEVTRDNSKLVDDSLSNQALKLEDIAAMKEAGKSGKEIVEALTTHSATFDTKSEFAQEKYKKRKAKKYVVIACARRPTTASIASAIWSKQPSRISYLRLDTLGILLHMANVGPGARVLVVESCGGMVTGAVAERMGGHGHVVATYLSPKPTSIELVKSFNFTPEIAETITQRSFSSLLLSSPKEEEKLSFIKSSDDGDGTEINTTNDTKKMLFSGLIVVGRVPLTPTTLIQTLFPLLIPSASFGMHSSHLQPLADALQYLRKSGSAVNVMLQEAWWREQQVLPGRTHPTMNMNHGGGYMLSGTVTLSGTSTRVHSA